MEILNEGDYIFFQTKAANKSDDSIRIKQGQKQQKEKSGMRLIIMLWFVVEIREFFKSLIIINGYC